MADLTTECWWNARDKGPFIYIQFGPVVTCRSNVAPMIAAVNAGYNPRHRTKTR